MIGSASELARSFVQTVESGKQIWITPHVRADGDAIGTGIAFAMILRKAGY